MTSEAATDLLSQVEHIRPLIEEHAPSAEANRQLSGEVYDAMYDAGLFAMLAPKAHGGLELHPVETMRVWEAVARIDSAAAWNLVMNQAIAAYAAWLPAEGARELFRDGPTTVAGALNPPAAATRVEGGWRITGQVPVRQRVPQRASGWPCRRWRWTATAEGRPGDRAADALRGLLAAHCGQRSWTPGTPSACAARARPTTP